MNMGFVGNMMQSVVPDGNLLDKAVLEENWLDEFVNDVNLMYLQRSSEVTEKGIPVSARELMNKVCHKAYAGL